MAALAAAAAVVSVLSSVPGTGGITHPTPNLCAACGKTGHRVANSTTTMLVSGTGGSEIAYLKCWSCA